MHCHGGGGWSLTPAAGGRGAKKSAEANKGDGGLERRRTEPAGVQMEAASNHR